MNLFVDHLFYQKEKCDWSAGLTMVDFPGGGGCRGTENRENQIKINYPPCILKLCGQVCLRILVGRVRSFLYVVFNCIEYGTSLLRESLH